MSNRSLLATLCILLSISVTSVARTADPVAVGGVLDLREYDFMQNGVINIKGEWRFYWNEVINPSSYIDSAGYIVQVPSSWRQLGRIHPEITPQGYGSYVLKILLPGGLERIGFRFTEVFSGSGYYVNGKNIGFNGFPGANPYQNLFDTRPSLYTSNVSGEEVDLVVHVSNFNYRSGGMKGRIEMGIPMQLMNERARRQHMDFFLLGSFLMIGVFFLGMYFIHTELYKLFFSLICILFAFRMFLLSESGYLDFFSGITHIRLEYISFSIMVPLFIMMIRYLFPNDFPSKVFKVIMWTCSLMLIILIVSPIGFFSSALTYYFLFVVLASVVVLYVMYLALMRGRSFSIGYSIGVIFVMAGAINDILIVTDAIDAEYKAQYGMFGYVLIYSMIFSLKSNRALKKTEELSDKIAEVNENLESIVEDRTKELHLKSEELLRHEKDLEERNQELQQMINVRNRFFAIIGHDIRGPVGYTSQMLELLLEGEIKESEKKEIMELLVNSSKATVDLLENLLLWGRSQIGNLKATPETIVLMKIVNETVQLFNHAFVEKKIELQVDIAASATMFADKEQLKMIVRNLVSNAIKFTGKSGKIVVKAEHSAKDNETLLSITDTGPGIPSSRIDSLFSAEEFYTTEGTNNEKGSGLGLKLCHELVQLNKGWIRVESKSGKGSTFTIGLSTK